MFSVVSEFGGIRRDRSGFRRRFNLFAKSLDQVCHDGIVVCRIENRRQAVTISILVAGFVEQDWDCLQIAHGGLVDDLLCDGTPFRDLLSASIFVDGDFGAQFFVDLGLKVFNLSGTPQQPRLIASNNEKEIGQTGEPNIIDVIKTGRVYYGKEEEMVSVVIPLRDRNGDALAAVRVQMKTFKGQTEENAILRAVPIVKHIQEKITTADDLN